MNVDIAASINVSETDLKVNHPREKLPYEARDPKIQDVQKTISQQVYIHTHNNNMARFAGGYR